MKRSYLWIVALFLFMSFSSLRAASIFGTSGLVHTPYADTMIKGSYDVGLFSVYTDYMDDLRGQTGTIYLTSFYSIYDWLEIGFNFPFYLVSPDWMGISSPFIGLKGRFFKKSNFVFSLLPYLKPSFAGDPLVGSGKFGYGASLLGQWNLGKVTLLGRIGYEKGEYFDTENSVYVQDNYILGSAAAEWDLTPKFNLFGEVIGSSARDHEDEDLFFQAGVKFFPFPQVYLTASMGTGLAGQLRSNTDRRVVAGITYYTTPLPPPAETRQQKRVTPAPVVRERTPVQPRTPAPVVKRKPVVMLISACGDIESAREIASMFEKKGLQVLKPIVASKEKIYTTEIIFSTAQRLAFNIARWIPGRQKIIKRIPLGYQADVVVRVGCDVSKKAKEKKKPISQIKIAVLNACRPGVLVAENVAKILLLAGYNVERIGEYDKYDHSGYTEILYKPFYLDYAKLIAQKIPGKQKFTQIPPTYGEEEIIILVGCDQMQK